MSFCKFSKEATNLNKTSVDNLFITNYMPEATENAVKVYLYGLYLCQNSGADDINVFSETLKIDVAEVKEIFKFWDDYGVVSIVTTEPFTVTFNSLSENGIKYKKFKPEKYADFTKALQLLITDRMIHINEYNEYFNLMESTSIKPEALLMIVKYCIDLKGSDIGNKYIITVAKDFISRGITTAQLVERELSDYTSTSKDVYELFSALKINKKAEIEDQQLYKKWTENYGYDKKVILTVAKNQKVKNFKKLDVLIGETFSNKLFTEDSVIDYFKNKEKLYSLCVDINKQLGIYLEVLEPAVNTYIAPWKAKGYDDETLLYIANRNLRKNKRSLEQMNDTVNNFYKRGLVTLSSITEYISRNSADEKFIAELLEKMGTQRSPNEWDKENLAAWRSWNFTDDMIMEAGKRAVGKSNPMIYINSILSNWKSKNIYTLEAVNLYTQTYSDGIKKTTSQGERKYTTEELVNRVNKKYLELKTKEESRLTLLHDKLAKTSGYTELENEIGKTNLSLAKAEYDGNENLSYKLKTDIELLNRKKLKILEEIGITEDLLKPNYSCKECNDTGFVNGVRCNCFYKYLDELTLENIH